MSEATEREREPIVPENGISFELAETLNDENTVGLCESVTPGRDTITTDDGVDAFRRLRRRLDDPHDLGESSMPTEVFVTCHGGELRSNTIPAIFEFIEKDVDGDRIPETCISVDAYALAMDTLLDDDAPYWRDYPEELCVMFDDCGLIVFETAEKSVVCTPIHWPWQYEAPRPRTPRGPSP